MKESEVWSGTGFGLKEISACIWVEVVAFVITTIFN
jgi:hypothetical protein